jgi:hypothetical protein
MEKRYKALRIISTIYKVLAAIVAVLTILSILGFCATSLLGGAALDSFGDDTGIADLFSGVLGALIFSVVAIIYGGGLSVTLYAVGDILDLLLALEENTRRTAMLLQR